MLTYRKSSKKLHLFKSLDTLKILTFWQIIKDKNILLLDFDYVDGKKYSPEQKNETENLWFRLYDEYFLLLNDSKSRFELSKSFDELKIRDKITQIKNNYDTLVYLKKFSNVLPKEDLAKYEQEVYNILKKIEPKIKPMYFGGIDANLVNLDKVIKALINQYNLNHKQNSDKIEKEIKNVYEVVANAESWLERNLNINDMVVSHWIAIRNQIAQKQKAQQKKNSKNGK
jgi:hypothetical protein